jgi:hypothetical protein
MLVDHGRLDADVVKDWKKAHVNCVHNNPDPPAIPHHPPDQAAPLFYNPYDPMHFPHPPIVPTYPTVIFPMQPVGITDPQQLAAPVIYPDPNNMQPMVNQADLAYHHET